MKIEQCDEIKCILKDKCCNNKYISSVNFNEDEINYLILFLKNVEKTPRIDADIEGFIKIMKSIHNSPELNINLHGNDIEELMNVLCYKYNSHFDLRCDLYAYIIGYYYNRGNISGISSLISYLYDDYLKKVSEDKKRILEETKGYNKEFQSELINLYIYKCYSAKKIIDRLPSKEIVNDDYIAINGENIKPLCVTLFEKYLSGDVHLDEYSNELGRYNEYIPVPYTKDDFLSSIFMNLQKIYKND